jgi:endonuclease/exonuclease/phosphatase (EEP) superfamily protein YafD
MRLLIGLIRLGVSLGTLVVAGLAVLALLGFAVPELDLLNHAQVLLFGGALAALVLALLLFGGSRWRRWIIGIAAAGLLASAITFVPEVISGFQPRAPLPADGTPVLKLMTHNLFGLNYEMDRVAAIVADEDPDIIALQEYFSEQSSELHPVLRERYPYFAQCRGGKRANIGLYSKLPFTVAEGAGACPDDGKQRTARILATFHLADGSSFSVITTHLDWPVPVQRQVTQFAELREAVDAVGGPLLVAGDFNSTPWSYALRRFGEQAGLERQTRNLVTYPLRFTLRRLIDTTPFLPLDHVMTRGGIAVHELHAGPYSGSDHLPVIASFSVQRPRGSTSSP